MATQLQVRAPGAGPWVLAWLAATLAAEALTAPLMLLRAVAWVPLLAILVAVVTPLAVAVALVVCRRRARREAMTRSDVMSVFFATGAGALVATPALISLVFGIAALIQPNLAGSLW